MKIKFIKEYQAFLDFEGSFEASNIYKVGDTKDVDTKAAQWLIDNGFAEEVNKSGWWKPESYEKYYFLSNVGDIIDEPWFGGMVDESRYSVGNCFKTEEAAERYLNYLKAIATVRQDEGAMTPEELIHAAGPRPMISWLIARDGPVDLAVSSRSIYYSFSSVSTIYFDTRAHAQASLDKHLNEWKIIANYDWSRE